MPTLKGLCSLYTSAIFGFQCHEEEPTKLISHLHLSWKSYWSLVWRLQVRIVGRSVQGIEAARSKILGLTMVPTVGTVYRYVTSRYLKSLTIPYWISFSFGPAEYAPWAHSLIFSCFLNLFGGQWYELKYLSTGYLTRVVSWASSHVFPLTVVEMLVQEL